MKKIILLFFTTNVIFICQLSAFTFSQSSHLYHLKFTGFVKSKEPILNEAHARLLIQKQLTFLISPLSQGKTLESSPPVGYKIIPAKDYSLANIKIYREETENIVEYSYEGHALKENTLMSISTIQITLPLFPEIIKQQGLLKKPFSKKKYNPCSNYTSMSEFSFAWRPWKPKCRLKRGKEYEVFQASLNLPAQNDYTPISFTPKPNVFLIIYDDVINRIDTGDLTRKSILNDFKKIPIINKNKNHKNIFPHSLKKIKYNYYQTLNAYYHVIFGNMKNLNFYKGLEVAFNQGDIIYYIGHTDIIRHYHNKLKTELTLSTQNQLFILDSCSSYYFDKDDLMKLKKSGDLAIITNGAITRNTNNKAIKLISYVESNSTIDPLEYFRNIDIPKYYNEMMSLSVEYNSSSNYSYK